MTRRCLVVDGEAAEDEGLRSGVLAQRRLDARRELGRREGLDQVVGRAPLQRPRDGLVAPVGGDEDDRQVGELGHGLHQLDAVGAAGQHQVEQHQAGALRPDDLRELAGVGGGEWRIAGPGQRVAHEVQRPRVVVHHQDRRRRAVAAGRERAAAGGRARGVPGRRDR